MIGKTDEYQRTTNKTKRAFERGGFTGLARKIYEKLLGDHFKLHTSYWYIKELNGEHINITPKFKVDVNYNAMQETLDWERDNLHDGKFYTEEFKEISAAQKYSHYMVRLSHDNEIIGFLKVGFRKVYIKEYKKIMVLPQNTVFIYDTFICENYRGFGMAPYMVSEVMKNLTEKGIEYVMCLIVPGNLASQNAYGKIGFKRIKYIWHLRLYGLRVFNINPEKLIYRSSLK